MTQKFTDPPNYRMTGYPHTPTPWKYATNMGPTQAVIVEADGSTVLDLRTTIGKRSELEANAKFIVRACNLFDEMVTALREARSELRRYAEGDELHKGRIQPSG